MRIEHIAIWTEDVERAKDFYVTFFGGEANQPYHNLKTGFNSYFIRFATGARLEIMNRPEVNRGEAVNHFPVGYAHLAFAVGNREEVDALTWRIREAGYSVLSEPRTTGDGYYESCVADPDGNQVEITV